MGWNSKSLHVGARMGASSCATAVLFAEHVKKQVVIFLMIKNWLSAHSLTGPNWCKFIYSNWQLQKLVHKLRYYSDSTKSIERKKRTDPCDMFKSNLNTRTELHILLAYEQKWSYNIDSREKLRQLEKYWNANQIFWPYLFGDSGRSVLGSERAVGR